MPRPPRIQYPGAIHHVTSRGVLRTAIFRTDDDRSVFVATLADATMRCGWECIAYCLMPNHYHLLVATPDPNLPQGMHQLNATYATRFNTAHERIGHLFERRYRSELIRRDSHLLEAARYTVLNPVRSGLAVHAGDWPWSSYRATASQHDRPPWLAVDRLVGMLDGEAGYREFVLAGANRPARPTLAELVPTADTTKVAAAVDAFGYTQAAVARHLGVSEPTVSRMVRVARENERKGSDPVLSRG